MGAAAAVSRGFGGLRVLVIAAVLGTTYLGNTFQSSNTVSNVAFELLAAGALSAVLVPTFVRRLEQSLDDAELLAGELLGLTVVVLGAVAAVGIVAAPWIAELLTAAVDDPAVATEQQELSTFLLRWFMPQIVLYGLGAIATALLHAKRSFIIPALAPIANTVLMVGCLLAFRASAGVDPGFDLTTGEQYLLAAAGTLGVAGFVAVPTVAVWRGGFRLWPRWSRSHGELGQLVRLSGWATLQHGFIALLAGVAIIAGGKVEGGVVAYQVAWFFFLAPYGIIAQPIHTTVLPELVDEHAAGRHDAFQASIGWAMDSMTVLLLPLTAICVALSVPAMGVLAFGEAANAQSVELLAAALVGLSLGFLPYGVFFLFTRAWYTLNNSRVPAIAGACGAVGGIAVMLWAALAEGGTTLVLMLGVAHTIAFTIAAVVLAVSLRRRTGHWAVPRLLPASAAISGLLGVGLWFAYEGWSPNGRLMNLVALVVLSGVGLTLYAAALHMLGVSITKRLPGASAAVGS
jgi:putative peptidoglycan lipid II flippase